MTEPRETSARWYLRWVSSRQFEVYLLTLSRFPSSHLILSLMKFIRKNHKPMADANPGAVRRKTAKQPKFNDKDLKRTSGVDDVL